MLSPLKHIIVSGSPFERGTQYGETLRHDIRDFLNDNIARINSIRRNPFTLEEALGITDSHIPHIEACTPQLAEEIKGLAQGAGISYREGMLLQLRREIIATGLECTAFACFSQEGRAVIAQNVDLAGGMTDLGMILEVQTPGADPDLLMYTHVGLIGYLGINSYGLGIGLNMVLSPGWRPGVPPYLLIRHLLHQPTLEKCEREIGRVRRASSRNLLMTDGMRLVNVEMTVEHERSIEDSLLVHTNHYLHEDFIGCDLVNPNTSTYPRLKRAKDRLRQYGDRPAVWQMEELLAYHESGPGNLCVHQDEDLSNVATIASVILEPSTGRMRICKGYPCTEPFYDYRIERSRMVCRNTLFN
ncbi:C45 family autoproteolytic acyltransferase/hydolase [Paenibacillus amylolyticus]|uniref:C45 family autoproteolytic acyltransferase/hydolase n=1 Tax=Paenibacillus amylolyticus TaxID=1451 RepID=UPI003EC0B96F